MLIYAFNKY